MRRLAILLCVVLLGAGCDWRGLAGRYAPRLFSGGADGQEAYFLGNEASVRWMNYLNAPAGDWEHLLNEQERLGATHLWLYAQNGGDGPWGNWSPIRDDGSVDNAVLDRMESRIAQARKRGFFVILWLRADDSARLNRRPMPVQTALHRAVVDRVDAMVAGYVIGLEANEYMGRAMHDQLSADLRTRTAKSIGAHMTPMQFAFAYSPGITHFYMQAGWVGSAGELEAKARTALASIPPHVKLVLAEYDKSSDSGYGRTVWTVDPRIVGYGNGFLVLPLALALAAAGGVAMYATRKGKR